jgi:hypothetical protein
MRTAAAPAFNCAPETIGHRDSAQRIAVEIVGKTWGIFALKLEPIAGDYLRVEPGPDFLMVDVEIIAIYEPYNINRIKLENVIHRVFDLAQLDIE